MKQDWVVNRGRPQIQISLLLFRCAGELRTRAWSRPLAVIVSAAYRAFALGLVGIDIPVSTRIGDRLRIHHGIGLVVNSNTVIGRDVTLRQTTTIGSKADGAAPVLKDGVDVGPNSVLLGGIVIGELVQVGAGSVVTKDVPATSVVVGNPARVLSS